MSVKPKTATGTIPLVVEYAKKSNNFPSQKKVSYGEKCFGDNVAVILLKKDRPCRYNWETNKKHCEKRVSIVVGYSSRRVNRAL